eukprot:SAG22_NODE_2667_length_2321_cov_2.752475_1_plen_543_part_10
MTNSVKQVHGAWEGAQALLQLQTAASFDRLRRRFFLKKPDQVLCVKLLALAAPQQEEPGVRLLEPGAGRGLTHVPPDLLGGPGSLDIPLKQGRAGMELQERAPSASTKLRVKITGAEERESVASLASVISSSFGLAEKVETLASRTSVSLDAAASKLEGQKHTVYVLEWTDGATGEVWKNERRYSEFDKLRRALLKDPTEGAKFKQLDSLPSDAGRFPGKKAGGGTREGVVEARRLALEKWMTVVLSKWGAHFLVKSFCRPVTLSADIIIPDYEEKTDASGKEYTVYHVEWAGGDRSQWTAARRYSDFERLRKALLADGCDVKRFDALPIGGGGWPKKRMSGVSWDEFLEFRRAGLEAWLRAVVDLYPSNAATLAFYECGAGGEAPMTRLQEGASRADNPSNPRGRAIMLANRQANRAAALQVGGLLVADQAWGANAFTVDGAAPLANGRPHWSNGAGGHLYFWPKTGHWLLNDSYAPSSADAWAFITSDGAVPTSAHEWTYRQKVRELVVTEVLHDGAARAAGVAAPRSLVPPPSPTAPPPA